MRDLKINKTTKQGRINEAKAADRVITKRPLPILAEVDY